LENYNGVQMATIKIDDQEYDSDKLPQETIEQINALQHTTREIARLQLQLAAMQTANNAYSKAVRESLEKEKQKEYKKTPVNEIAFEDNSAINFDNL
jgi:undecaprenyl pyrophosphate synthase